MEKEFEVLEDFKIIKLKTINAGYNYGYKVWDNIEQALLELQAIKNTKPSEAMKCLEVINNYGCGINDNMKFSEVFEKEYNTINQTLLKAQKLEKENDALKEIIKSFFDKGSPLHQYIDKDGVLTIEVDDECSIMHLGKFKDVDLDKKLKEVLE